MRFLKKKSQERNSIVPIFKPSTPQNSLVSGGYPRAGMVARGGGWVCGQRKSREIAAVCRGAKVGRAGPQLVLRHWSATDGVVRNDTEVPSECHHSPL